MDRFECEQCGAPGAAYVEAREAYGFLVGNNWRTYKAFMCRRCGVSRLQRSTFKTGVLAWFALGTFFSGPLVILQNVVSGWRFASATKGSAVSDALALFALASVPAVLVFAISFSVAGRG